MTGPEGEAAQLPPDCASWARLRVSQVFAEVASHAHWLTEQNKPFDAEVRGDLIIIRPLHGKPGSRLQIPRVKLEQSFEHVCRMQAKGIALSVSDFTATQPSGHWRSYAASFFHGKKRAAQVVPSPFSTPKADHSPAGAPAPNAPRVMETLLASVTIADALHRALRALSVRRPVFHNEADFQHALGQVITHYGFEEPRLERRLDFAVRANLDIYTTWFDARVGIELKYKTSPLQWASSEGEAFRIQAHAAHDPNRWLFLNDIQRLEYAKGRNMIDVGFGIILSNDSAYWTLKRGAGTPFAISEGAPITGNLRWGHQIGPGTRAGKNRPIQLAGTYNPRWTDFSLIPNQPNGKFRYLAFEVSEPNNYEPWGEETEPAGAKLSP